MTEHTYPEDTNYELQLEQGAEILYDGEKADKIPLKEFQKGLGSYDLRLADGRQKYIDEENIVAIHQLG